MFEDLAHWSQNHYSDLPWRVNRNLYTTLVSEMMLQQTTVSTVINHFDKFIEKYPTIEDLASIDEEQILKDWKGLGYYRRAKNLLGVAKQISHHHEGKIPLCYETLISIKGIGPYTANALLGIGANKNVLALDANLERVLSRYYGIDAFKGIFLQKEIQKLFLAKKIAFTDMERLGGRVYNEALMDLGRSLCKANKAHCDLCNLKDKCVALKEGNSTKYPRVDLKIEKKKSELTLLRVIVRENDKVLAYKKTDSQWLSGQYEIPSFVMRCSEYHFRQYPYLKADGERFFILPSFMTSITHYKIFNYVLYANVQELKMICKDQHLYEWVSISNGNLSTSTMKSIDLK